MKPGSYGTEEIGSVCLDTKMLVTGSKDAISWLPQEVLGDILSLVPTKLAASTSLLSKKWRNVFALVHNLDFDDSVFLQPEEGKEKRHVIRECFRSFVDRTLALQCASPIKKFSLKYHYDYDSELTHVVRWVCNALDRGVLELAVSIKPRYEPYVRSETGHWKPPLNAKTHGEVFLPPALFTSKTLVKLTLGTRVSFGKLPPDLSLPALKSLFIDSIFFEYEDLCYVLLPGCPVLEELFVCHKQYMGIPYCISSRTIEKLSVQYNSDYDLDCMIGMSFDAPRLVFLDYSDYAVSEYPQVNLKSLVEARLDLRYSKKIRRPDISGLFIGISNIETLHLSANSVDVISRCVKHGVILPVFNNLVSLTFGSKKKRGWRLLPYLLKQSPMLETLIIQGLDGNICDVTLRPYQVKVLHVLGYGGAAKELEQLKSFLGKTECLELVQVEVVDDGIISQTYKDLMTLVGVSVSPKCQIKVA
ncbi:F-box/LRR-repeat protein At3g60040 [Capsella rubella]|uniref:F-box/LRR-repeat protein At3g60040 n=1 Tax=Capsella rubella TaxID=81985 RepID=UPI000CD59847|nr:F-box/LRR-repeat protein At3g60040 [Capsella rubella]